MVLPGEVSEQSSARTLSHVVRDVEDPKPEDEGTHRPRLGGAPPVPEQPPDVGGVADDQHGEGDRQGPGDDERPPAAEAAGAAVAHVAHQGLDDEPGQRAAEPDNAGPGVGDPQLLHVRGQQRELQRPPELDPARDRGHAEEPPERDPRLRRRRGLPRRGGGGGPERRGRRRRGRPGPAAVALRLGGRHRSELLLPRLPLCSALPLPSPSPFPYRRRLVALRVVALQSFFECFDERERERED